MLLDIEFDIFRIVYLSNWVFYFSPSENDATFNIFTRMMTKNKTYNKIKYYLIL